MNTTVTTAQALQMAIQHHQAGRLADAEVLYRRILEVNPNEFDALHLLGVLAHQVGHNDAAIELIQKAIAIAPKNAAALCNLGEAYRMSGRPDEAEASYRRALAIDPNMSTAHTNLGIVQHTTGRSAEAEASYRRAMQLEPKMAAVRSNLGNLLSEAGRNAEGEAMHREAIAIDPRYAAAYNNLAALQERGERIEEARAGYKRAIEIEPRFVDALNNLGNVEQKRGNFDAAIVAWQRALAVVPEHVDATWNHALALLATGNYAAGWEGYEKRFRCNHSRQYWREYPKPRWDGGDLSGKTLLLYPEQGFGDVIQFARFIEAVAQRGIRVVLECQSVLVELMKTVPGVAEVFPTGQEPPAFDAHLNLLSLGQLLGVTLGQLPGRVPYLFAAGDRVDAWRRRLADLPGKKIGIVWSGNTMPDPQRNCPVELLASLGEAPSVSWVSLQKDAPPEALEKAKLMLRLFDAGPELTNFAETAAVVGALDMVITIDTAVAHLCGAVGAKTWTLVPFAPDWRWMHRRDDSPWYPTMKLFRQPQRGEWKRVIERVAAALQAE